MKSAYFLICAILLCHILSSTAQTHESLISQLDVYIENARVQWETPGLAVAVVKDGQVLLSKGYGEIQLGTGRKVDGSTIFSIGSTTKAMVAAAVAMLVDEGKVSWDDLVTDHLPSFKLADPYVTNEVRVRDLFTHNTGLGNTDLLWVLWDHSTEEIVRRIRRKELSYSFRGGYTYQNIMYATAGLLIEKLSGETWDSFVEKRIFQPLGMNNTYPTKSRAISVNNRSVPHYKWSGSVNPIIDSNADSIGAAGSVWSCTDDMVKWMQFVLDSARVNGTRLISKASFTELHRPHIVIPKGSFYPTSRLTQPVWTTYSLGWFQHDYHGRYVQFHTGSLNGTVAIIGLLPSEGVGVYVFGNLDHAEVRHAIMYKVFDLFLDAEPRDWSTEFLGLYGEIDRRAEISRNAIVENRVPGTKTTLSLKEYEGSYSSSYLGDVKVSVKDDQKLSVYFRPDRQMTLDHWHYDTFFGTIDQYPFDGGTLVRFDVDASLSPSLVLFGHTFDKVD